ncbi:hypothetical protein [Geodermatophilus amargosae]|uniref:hypothetical protein n=1 Tax=Geodermatophilus amargosae TaxID=1296565 RepID=UPI0034DE8088
MSAPTLPAPRRPFPSTPARAGAPEAAGDGLGIADLVDLLGLDLDRLLLDTAEEDAAAAAAAAREPVDPVAVVRGWVRRAAAWGSGPQRSWCAW